VDPADHRPSWFVLVYDDDTMEVDSLSGFGDDYVGALLSFSARMDQHRRRPAVAVRLYQAASLAELVERHADLFARLRFPGGA
jgi:hypothetical protein